MLYLLILAVCKLNDDDVSTHMLNLLTDGISDFVWSGALARFSRSSIIDSNHSEFPLTVLWQVRYREWVSSYRRRVYRRPVTSTRSTLRHRAFLDLVACQQLCISVWMYHNLLLFNYQPPYTDPLPSSSSPPRIKKFFFFVISRFIDHVTILFTLLRTWENFVTDVMVN